MKRLANIVISLFAALKPEEITSSTINGSLISSTPSICRSNSTHIVWKLSQQQQQQQNSEHQCIVQTRKNAEKTCMEYLKNNIMPFDEPFKETMGFPLSDNKNDADADGLGNGLVGPTVALALDAKVQYKYTDNLQPDIFFEYVLNYANLNEARTNWRPLIVNALKFNESDLYHSSILKRTTKNNTITNGVDADADDDDAVAIAAVTRWVNTHLWTKLARHEDEPIYFKSSQTPLIFDPMSIIAFGYASCTGTSILFSNGLRACGIAARVVGTPAWYGNRTNGNHNWVEVYVPNNSNNNEGGGEWKFLEPSPALAHVDTLDDDPCNRWFCDPSRYPSSKVYAAKLSNTTTTTPTTEGYFPLAWEWDCHDVPAEDRTDYYTRVCGSCASGDKQQ